MNRTELERAWPAAEPPGGFVDRVVERLQGGPASAEQAVPDPAMRRAHVGGWPCAPAWRWLALPAVALVVGGLFALWPAQPAREGEVIAAEPRSLSIGERAVAELSSGARVRWSIDAVQQGVQPVTVQQDSGEVTYRVEPGAPFRVQTPHGSVAVLGTVFRVVVADTNTSGAEQMKKAWSLAGAAATLGALLFVSVDRGGVLLANGEHQLALSAGQTASIGGDGVPRLDTPTPKAAAAAQGAASADADAERKRLRQVADTVRRNAARQRAARAARAVTGKPGTREQGPAEPAAPPIVFRPHPQAPPGDHTAANEDPRRDYVRRALREQYIPVARDCYEELLVRQPAAAGRVTLKFAIVGDGDAGVVDRVELQDDTTTIDDEEFRLCMRESMFTAVFEPPPPGASETTVVYPVVLSPE